MKTAALSMSPPFFHAGYCRYSQLRQQRFLSP